MSLPQFREAMASRMGRTLTPELCAQIEAQAFSEPDRSLDPGLFGAAQCGRLGFHVERFADCLPELHLLHLAHWGETEKHRHGLQMNPDYEAMKAAERRGEMVQFVARAGGQLVGNCRVYVKTSLHTGTRFAVEDTLYLTPEFRGGRNALRFIQFAEAGLHAIGVREIRCTAKLVNGTARFFEAAGYRPVATELVKFLGEHP